MRADVYPLDTVLGENHQWVVPVYQRHYAWKSDDEKQITKFWDDLRNQALALLEERTLFPHYFGAIIYAEPSNQPFGTVRQRYLVDGQQRITTFQLLLTALREAARSFDQNGIDDVINAYLFNEESKSMVNPNRERFKLWSSSYDRKLFQDILQHEPSELRQLQPEYFYKNENLIKGSAPNLLRAYLFLYDKICCFVRSREEIEKCNLTIDALLRSFLTGFQIVVIKLEENDDAQEIFASLNGMAEPLTPFDLIRNDVFHRARKLEEDGEQLFDQKWKSFEQPFWSLHVRQGRFKKARADHFVSHAVIAETAQEINVGKVAAEYHNFVEQRKFDSVSNELDVLLAHGETYRALEEMPEGASTNRIANILRIWDLSTFHPLILWVNAQAPTDFQKKEIFSIVESYIIRREICGLTSKNYNKVVISLIKESRNNDDLIAAFTSQLASLSGDASKMPQDAEVFAACEQHEAYLKISSLKLQYILKNVEERKRTKLDEVTVSTSNLTIEHIMPQKWAEFWPLSNGAHAPCESVWDALYDGHELDDETRSLMEERKRALNTFGNLTLITGTLNSSIRNGPWKDKRISFAKLLLVLNRDISEEPNWDEKAIFKRSTNLAATINSIWSKI